MIFLFFFSFSFSLALRLSNSCLTPADLFLAFDLPRPLILGRWRRLMRAMPRAPGGNVSLGLPLGRNGFFWSGQTGSEAAGQKGPEHQRWHYLFRTVHQPHSETQEPLPQSSSWGSVAVWLMSFAELTFCLTLSTCGRVGL